MGQCLYALKVQAHWYRASRFLTALLFLLSGFAAATQAQAQTPPKLTLTVADNTVTEGETLTLTARLDRPPTEDIEIGMIVANSTQSNSSGSDFADGNPFQKTLVTFTLPGSSSDACPNTGACVREIELGTVDDNRVEGKETTSVLLYTGPHFIDEVTNITSNTATFVIADNERLHLKKTSYSVEEGAKLTVTAQLFIRKGLAEKEDDIFLARDIGVGLRLHGQSASATDFKDNPFDRILTTFTSCTVKICNKEIVIETLDNDLIGEDKHAVINLYSNPPGLVVNAASFVITDDDTVPADEPPVAHAGPNRDAFVGATVTLDGRLSRNPARSRSAIGLHYAWTAPAGVDLNDAIQIRLRPTFIVPDLPVDTELEFTLVVTNDDLQGLKSEPATVTITVAARPTEEPAFESDPVDQFWAVGQVVNETLPRMIADTDATRNGGTFTYSLEPALPTGLTFNAATRTITGTTSVAAERKTYTYTAVVRRTNTLVSYQNPNAPIDFSDPSICVSPDVVVNGVTSTCRGNRPSGDDVVTVFDQTFDIVVGGINPPPTAVATTTTERVGVGVVVTLDGTGSSDPDGEPLTYKWTPPSNVTLSSNTARQPTFTAPFSITQQVLNFSLVVTDQRGAASTNTATVVVTVAPAPNRAPTANAGPNQIVGGGETVTLNGSGSDPDPETVSLAWTPPADVTLSGNAEPQPTFTAPDATTEDQVLTFTLVATDNRGLASEEMTVAITVLAERLPMVESRTTGRVEEGQSASFALSLAEPFFPAGTPERLRTFTLYVLYDGVGSHALLADLVLPSLPVVFPAGRGIARFEVATLDDDIAEPLETLKLGLNGSHAAVEIADNEPYLVSFDPASVQFAEGEEQVVNINLDRPFSGRNSDSTLPANAQFIGAGGTATADYLADYQTWDITFADGDISVPVTFADGQQSVSVTLLAVADDRDEAAETTRLALVGNDLLRDNELPITIEASGTAPPSSANAIPTANAGAVREVVVSGSQVTLVGSGSDSGGGTVEGYRWTRTGGTGSSSVTLSSKEAQMPTFTADTLAPGALAVTHVFSLVVVDNDGAQSQPDEVTITVTSANKRPVAVAHAPLTLVAAGSTVTLDGTRSRDDDGTVVGYSWTRTVGTGSNSLTLNNPTSAMPTFTADTLDPGDASVAHVFRLVVTDDDGEESLWNDVIITVSAGTSGPSAAPTANAAVVGSSEVSSGSLVTLDGSGSTASDGTSEPDGYSWTRTGGTGSRSLTLSNPAVQQPTFTADTLAPGDSAVTHVFRLVVTDNDVDSSGSLVTITVTADPTTDLTVPVEAEQIVAARTDTLKRGVGALGSEIGSSLAGAVSARGGQAIPQNTLHLGAAAGSEQPGISFGPDFDPTEEYGSVKDAVHGLQASQLLDKSEDGARFAGVWLKGDVSRFKDRSGEGERDGDITSLHGGLDVRLTPRLLVGLGGSWHDGDFDYRAQGGIPGKAGFEIASLYPYVNWDHDGTSAWAALGLGSGELKVTEGDADRTSDVEQTLAAFGLAQYFEPSERIDTVLRLEAFYSNLEVEGTEAGQQALDYDGFDTEVWQLRGQGEVGWTIVEREGLHLRPYAALGLLLEDGGERGIEQEIGLDLNTADLHLRAEGRYHVLDEGSRVYGYSLSADYDSGDDSRGLQFALRAQQGRQRSLDEFDTNSSLRESQDADGRQTEAELGYGLLLGRGGLLKPYLARRFASERDSTELGLDYRLRALRMRLGYEQSRSDTDQSEDDLFSIKVRLEF